MVVNIRQEDVSMPIVGAIAGSPKRTPGAIEVRFIVDEADDGRNFRFGRRSGILCVHQRLQAQDNSEKYNLSHFAD
jgi:hypothetical protein